MKVHIAWVGGSGHAKEARLGGGGVVRSWEVVIYLGIQPHDSPFSWASRRSLMNFPFPY